MEHLTAIPVAILAIGTVVMIVYACVIAWSGVKREQAMREFEKQVWY